MELVFPIGQTKKKMIFLLLVKVYDKPLKKSAPALMPSFENAVEMEGDDDLPFYL